MNQEDIDYRTLRKIQQIEKNSPTLSKIDPNFYIEMSKYLKNLDKRTGKKPSSVKDQLLMDEIQNIKKIAISIYELREKKILLAAVSKARGGNPELTNMTDEEKNLYESVLNNMQDTRK